jgi:hypothetical protein
MHKFFPYFRDLCRTLEAHDIPYFLAGGTLLGAVRDGDLIAHDRDFDIDCLTDDLDKLFDLKDELAAKNIRFEPISWEAERMVPFNGEEMRPGGACSTSRLRLHDATTGQQLGDIYLFTVFSDGIARRYDCGSRSYFNAKMSIPAWYYESPTPVSVGGETFAAPRDPQLVAEKIYGPDWKTPMKSGQFGKERTASSGSVLDADRERLLLNALEKGWDGDYSNREPWPQPSGFMTNRQSLGWSMAHEPMLIPALSGFFSNHAIEAVGRETSPFRIQQYLRYFVARAWHEQTLVLRSAQANLKSQKAKNKELASDLARFKKLAKAQAQEIDWMKRVETELRRKPARGQVPSMGKGRIDSAESSGGGTSISHWLSRILRGRRSPNRDDQQIRVIRESGLFDPAWYLARYRDVASAGIDPAGHYLHRGAQEGRDPGPNFNTKEYLKKHPGLDASRTNPLVHFATTDSPATRVS